MLKKKFIVKALPVFAGVFLLSLSTCVVQEEQDSTVPKTGQTLCYDTAGVVIDCEGTGQDGEYQAGVASPDPRFMDNGDGTVTDNLTGLIWTKDTNIAGESMIWQEALDYCEELSLGACGDNWRLPNIREARSLSNYGSIQPSLPSGHPFINVVVPMYYWTSTTVTEDPTFAWTMNVGWGLEDYFIPKTIGPYTALAPTAWCVCGGQ